MKGLDLTFTKEVEKVGYRFDVVLND